MKTKIIIIVILILGCVVLIYPSLKKEKPAPPSKKTTPTTFKFNGYNEINLTSIFGVLAVLEIKINERVDKMELYYNDSIIKTWDNPQEKTTFSFAPGMFGLGIKTLNLLSKLPDGTSFIDNKTVQVLSDVVPQKKRTKIIQAYPHNPTNFTQGLEIYQGELYEGTGDPGDQGKTKVAQVNINTGESIKEKTVGFGVFGEGITILNNILYQLTWKNQKAYTYDIKNNLEKKGEFNYTGEGWGICNDGKSLIMSNGTEKIFFRDPETFEIKKTIEVYNNKGPINYLNELEYFDDKIYANVWTTNIVVVISPINGRVLEEIDATSLISEGRGLGGVLNGIAHNKKTNKTYMTGKNWSKLFHVEFIQ